MTVNVFSILVMIFIVTVIASLRPNSSGQTMEIQNTTAIRGIAAVGIVMHHIAQQCVYASVFTEFFCSGHLFAGLFFMLSG